MEFRSQRDAEDAYFDMYVFATGLTIIFFIPHIPFYRHGRNFEGSRLSIQVLFRDRFIFSVRNR